MEGWIYLGYKYLSNYLLSSPIVSLTHSVCLYFPDKTSNNKMSPRPAVTLSLLTLTAMLAGLEAKVHSQGEQQHHLEQPVVQPYLGSYQVEDSCQFVVCGQDFSQEFGVGLRPSQGSCSGDCDQLAASLVTNRFSREFLWSSCARMCQDKYTLQLFRSVTTTRGVKGHKRPEKGGNSSEARRIYYVSY